MTTPLGLIAPPIRKKRAELNFALPTINVALLLVLFFLVAGTIVEEEELGISPPEVMERPDTRLPRPLLAMTNEGQLLLDGVPITDAGLVEAALAAAEAAEGPLNILVPPDSAAGLLLGRISQIGKAGIPVRLVTARPSGSASGVPMGASGP
jgi:biopolymer transport protein ExbD